MRTTFFRSLLALAALFAPASSAAQTCSGSTTVTCVTASSPLSSTGGRTPQISLSGVVPIGNGGTGITSSPAGAGYYLRSSGAATWSLGTIQSGDLPSITLGGDLSGTTGSATVAKINGVGLGSTTATSGNVLIGSGSSWVTRAISGDLSLGSTGTATVTQINGVGLGTTTATAGNLLVGSGTQWITRAVSGDASLSSTGALTVTKINGTTLGTLTGATNGQALAWNGTAWTPTTYVAGSVNVSAPITGNGAGVSLGLSYGSGLTVSGGSLMPDFGTTSSKVAQGNDSRFAPAPSSAGRVLYDSGTAWTALAAGTAGQLLRGGSTPAWTTALTNGQILIGSTGSSPVAAALTSGGGITATGGAGSITLGSSAGGDLAGTVASATVIGLQGRAVFNAAPNSGDVLAWDGSQWTPGQVTYVNGINISVSSANLIFAGPSSGASAAPTFRQMVTADLPSPAGFTAPGLQTNLPQLAKDAGIATSAAGAYTLGAKLVFDTAVTITGGAFYYPVAGNNTVTFGLWSSGGTLLKSVNVSTTGANLYTATFASSYSASPNVLYYIGIYDGAKQIYIAPGSFAMAAPPLNVSPSRVGTVVHMSFGWFTNAGLAAPTTGSAALATPIAPSFTL